MENSFNDDDFIYFDSDGITVYEKEKLNTINKVSISNILSNLKLNKMSFGYYAFKISGGLLKILYNINYYTNISGILSFIATPLIKCKKKVYNIEMEIIDNHNININHVYFINKSPLRKEITKKQIIFGTNTNNVYNSWKTYFQEFNDKPKIGDIIEIHYTVPYKKINPKPHFTHTPYIVSYVYPSNIHFPPYNLESIRKYNSENKSMGQGVLFASCGEKDLTEEAIKLSGPLGNFYSDLPSRYGIRITRNLLVPDDNKEELIITDNNAEEHKFESNCIIKL